MDSRTSQDRHVSAPGNLNLSHSDPLLAARNGQVAGKTSVLCDQ